MSAFPDDSQLLHTRDMHHTEESIAPERRKRTRVQVHWQLCFYLPESTETVNAVTQDLSSDGFYCQANSVFIPGELRICTLHVPTHDPNERDFVRPVLCRVRVIRVEALAEQGLYGVGCRIEDYSFVGDSNGSSAPITARVDVNNPRDGREHTAGRR